MKFIYLIKIIIIGLTINNFLCPVIFSQQKIVLDYIKRIDSLNLQFNDSLKTANRKGKDPLRAYIETMDINELKHIASLMYIATDLDWLHAI